MSPTTRSRTFLVLTLGAALVACGGGTAVSPSTGTGAAETGTPATPTDDPTTAPNAPAATLGTALDACEIVSADDIKAATGVETVAAGVLEESPTTLSPGRTDCTYEGDFGRILVDVVPEDGADLYDAARGSYKDAVDITGLGDGAFTSKSNERAFIWKGAVNVMWTTFLNGDLEQVTVSTALGERIVAKL